MSYDRKARIAHLFATGGAFFRQTTDEFSESTDAVRRELPAMERTEQPKGGTTRKVIANELTSLDGVIQSSGSDDDLTGGSATAAGISYFDEIAMWWVVEGYQAAGGFLFGRRTYELLAGSWPNARDDRQALARPLIEQPKHVATTTLSDPLDWENAHVLQGDVGEAVRALKAEGDREPQIVGSSRLTQTLVERVLGGGKRFLPDDGAAGPLRLVESQVTTTGRFSPRTRRQGS